MSPRVLVKADFCPGYFFLIKDIFFKFISTFFKNTSGSNNDSFFYAGDK
jgi:hypothetical protein